MPAPKPAKQSHGGLFRSRPKALELDIDNYLALVDQSVVYMDDALKKYLDEKMDLFEKQTAEIVRVEREADTLRREIKQRLYVQMLIPDSRGDVLGLLETLDDVVDSSKVFASSISIEAPQIYPFLKDDFRELSETCVKAVAEITLAARAFFRDYYRVSEHVDKVYLWEHLADELEERIKRKAFQSEEIKLFRRMHIRYFAELLSRIADAAESVADRLAISAIKRGI